MQIIGAENGGEATLSFGAQTRTFEIEPESEEMPAGKVGIETVTFTSQIVDDGVPVYNSFRKMYDIDAGKFDDTFNYSSSEDIFNFAAPTVDETKLFVCASDYLVYGVDWTCKLSKGELTYEFTRDGLNYYSVARVPPRQRPKYRFEFKCGEKTAVINVTFVAHPPPRLEQE